MNEDVRVYFCPRSSEEMGHFGKAGTENRIPGVAKFSRMWLIPKDAEKPTDGRYKKRGDRVDKNSNM